MIYFSIAFLCSALLFMALLDDKYRLPVAVISNTAVYLLSLGIIKIAGLFAKETVFLEPIGIFINAAVLFLLSLFLYNNNSIQKLYIMVLAVSNYFFIKLFSELLLGLMPFSVSGVFAAFLSILCYALFTIFMILCMYRMFHHFRDRDVSGFIITITLLQLLPCVFCIGQLDLLFQAHIYAGRIFLSALVYLMILFSSRSIYQAARFREATTRENARMEMVDTQSGRYVELFSFVQDARRQHKEENYHLDTISQMVQEGATVKIPYYIESLRKEQETGPLLKDYSENPYVNAVMAVNAAYAQMQEIDFACTILLKENTVSTVDICMMSSEMLRKAMEETGRYCGEKRVRYTIMPANDIFKLEVIYTAAQTAAPKKLKLKDLKTQKLSNLLPNLLEENETDIFSGFGCTKEVVNRYSGKMDVSRAGEEILLSVQIHI